MKIVATPRCKKIVEVLGIKDFTVNKNPDEEEGDLAILMSESKTKMDSYILKLNSYCQIRRSLLELYYFLFDKLEYLQSENINDRIDKYLKESDIASRYLNPKEKREISLKSSNINVYIYSYFLKDIVEDMGFNILNHQIFNNDVKYKHFNYFLEDIKKINNNEIADFDYIIYPDYFNFNISDVDSNILNKFINIPSHGNISKDPLKRADFRYSLLEETLKQTFKKV
ncbi:hypothetical protein [Methanobrevibacter curvatus]|uniref:Uncharacterized protein n=1 Tax=Methanobrevibacter curvatus TaxID=49547 RepID=A0A166CBF3_9EURY|nr:hypothetical protein [Methanobrevibacter curvatus]KZX12877.1 hypothetical protein MBCUR_08380 [Methanobrevibacter curvatus]